MTQVAIPESQTNRSGSGTGALTRPRWHIGREVTFLLGGLALYRLVRLVVKDEMDRAVSNTQTVVDWERAIGIFNEVDLQSTILANDAVIWTFNRYYFFAHFIATAALLVWLFVRHFSQYGRVRRVLFGTTFTALAIHVAFPLAPPRWFPSLGFVDTLQTFGPRIYDSKAIANTANQIAAMPSLHVAWALILAWAVLRASTNRFRWVALLHPVAMTAAVVLTGNHWWLDVIGAFALVLLVIVLDAPIQARLEHRREAREARQFASLPGLSNS